MRVIIGFKWYFMKYICSVVKVVVLKWLDFWFIGFINYNIVRNEIE